MWLSPDDKGKGVSGCKGLGAGQNNGRAGRTQAVPDDGSNDVRGSWGGGTPSPPLSGRARFGADFQPPTALLTGTYDAEVPKIPGDFW